MKIAIIVGKKTKNIAIPINIGGKSANEFAICCNSDMIMRLEIDDSKERLVSLLASYFIN